MSTTELLAHEASITDFLVSTQEQGWSPEATDRERTKGFLERRTAALAIADTPDLAKISDEEFDQLFVA